MKSKYLKIFVATSLVLKPFYVFAEKDSSGRVVTPSSCEILLKTPNTKDIISNPVVTSGSGGLEMFI